MKPTAKIPVTSYTQFNVALRLLQGLFLLAAVLVVSRFAAAAQDGEERHSSDTLVKHLEPNYKGDNRTAPDFTLPDKDGKPRKLSDLRGRTVVLHFWTRTCLPCVNELHEGISVFDQLTYQRDDIALVLVSADANWRAIEPLMPRGLHAPVLFDPKRSVITELYGTTLFPETWIIDKDGVIRARFDHPLAWDSGVLLDYLASL